jgi:hypothetical protein
VPNIPDFGEDEISFLIKTRWLSLNPKPLIGARSDAPSRVRLLKINPEIANQTTLLAT